MKQRKPLLRLLVVAVVSLSGAALATIAAGAIFGLLEGTLLMSFASSIGATLAFLASRYVLREPVRRRFGPLLAALNARGANLRSHWLRLPFGDQGLLLPAACFAALGGFDETLQCGEDHRLVWTARRSGLPVVGLGAALETSARAYARHGWLRTTPSHARLTLVQAWPQWRALRRQRR